MGIGYASVGKKVQAAVQMKMFQKLQINQHTAKAKFHDSYCICCALLVITLALQSYLAVSLVSSSATSELSTYYIVVIAV